ncbi:tRNA A-37 threonylcarbamoyl transferase component Bud32 [Crossiella equi]|uniref:non-specific serine/threonine protein kinase n=1 Tax=Crossiella equi TaxID=130796 RepID=A0ABS5A5L7_9PSEU|nr:class IV lanthionine synthetase LanL [Crossiella equi]MBP2471884.1 tRNA A-37 threonylcarbamoyl transferase component Bud32 [Crossiella equi]
MGEQGVIERRLRGLADEHGRRVHAWDRWIGVNDPVRELPGQGWKIHIAARPATILETLDRIVPVLLAHSCDFKVVRSRNHLRELNSSTLERGSVGKAVTAYPRDTEAFTALVRELGEVLAGFTGPVVNSDRRLRPDAPVYYRFGPFTPSYALNGNGALEAVVRAPDGSTRPGAAQEAFQLPDWLTDPCAEPASPAASPGGAPVLGDRYRVRVGVQRSAKGAVYRAEDLTTGAEVIVKQARAHIDEDLDGRDVRMRLRHERAILTALAEVPEIPDVLDHFRHGEDEYLVTTSAGATSLSRWVGEHGTYAAEPATGRRSLPWLARRLLGILDAVHARGVVVRDLTPTNVVLTDDGDLRLVDFEVSRFDDLQFFGWTPGFTPLRQREHPPGEPSDDYHALGATLFYAATGRDPSYVPTGPVRDVGRVQTTLELTHGGQGGVLGLVPLLLHEDPGVRTDAADRLRRGETARTTAEDRAVREAAAVFAPDTGRLAEIVSGTAALVAAHAERLMDPSGLPREVFSSPANVYYGSAGTGLELLRHLPGHAELVGRLAHWTARTLAPHPVLRGLMFGGSGTAVFLAATGAALADPELLAQASALHRRLGEGEDKTDITHGHAGLVLAELALWRHTGREEYLAAASASARRLRTDGLLEQVRATTPDYRDQPGLAGLLGFAHGLSGHTHALLTLRAATGGTGDEALLHEHLDLLAKRAGEYVGAARTGWLNQMCGSWCQGFAGIGTTLARAVSTLDRPDLLPLLDDLAEVSLATAPRLLVASQCCGLTGVGEFLLDHALLTGRPADLDRAHAVLRLLLARAGGPPEAPEFPDQSRIAGSGTWATGAAGVLSFARRLRDRTPDRLWLDVPVSPA